MVANVHPFLRKKKPVKIVTPLSGHGGCDDPWWPMCLLYRGKGRQPRSSRRHRPGMVAVTILAGHCASFPTNIVTPSLPRHGGSDDPWWPMCIPSCGKRNQPRSSRPPCSGGCDDPWWPMCLLHRGKRRQPRSSRPHCPGMVAVTILGCLAWAA